MDGPLEIRFYALREASRPQDRLEIINPER